MRERQEMGEKRAEAEHGGHKPPSRIRYEESHPVVSFRVNREVYQQLKDLLAKSGKSISDLFREALGAQKASAGDAYQQGYRRGYEEATKLYRVTYPCSTCGEPIELASSKAKEAASEYMMEHGWGHSSCHNKPRRRGY